MTRPDDVKEPAMQTDQQAFVTDSMVEAGRVSYFHFRRTIEGDVLFRDLMEEEQEAFVRATYLAMTAAKPVKDEVIERVARAICEAKGYDADMPISETKVQWEAFKELARTTALAQPSPQADGAERQLYDALKALRGNISCASLVHNPVVKRLRDEADAALALFNPVPSSDGRRE
jgi:hypothetical protein